MLSCWPGRKQRSVVNCLGKSHIARTREWSPRTENDSWKTASKKKGTSVLNYKAWILPKTWISLKEDSKLQMTTELHPTSWLQTLEILSGEPVYAMPRLLTYRLLTYRNYEIINGCCFKAVVYGDLSWKLILTLISGSEVLEMCE